MLNVKSSSSWKAYTKFPESWRKILYTPDSRMELYLRFHPFQYLEIEESDHCDFAGVDKELVTCNNCDASVSLNSLKILSLFIKYDHFKCKGILLLNVYLP